ncbi:hypothetical protein CGRA01v4_08048 [Colletotrichum graminicola]|nr:hypothetical protein CGRA01v4_08048 [Colletotrichum graminicola]
MASSTCGWVHSGNPCDLQSWGGGGGSFRICRAATTPGRHGLGLVDFAATCTCVPCFVMFLACLLLSHSLPLSFFFSTHRLVLVAYQSASQGRRCNSLPNEDRASPTGGEVDGRGGPPTNKTRQPSQEQRELLSRICLYTRSDLPPDILGENSG